MTPTFKAFLAYGEALEKAAADHLIPKLFPLCDAYSIGADKAWMGFGADFLLRDRRSGKMMLVEIKADFKTTGNLVIENYSADRKTGSRTCGWLHTSKADYLLYIGVHQRRVLVLDLPKLRWLIPKLNLKEKNTQLNPGYVTHFYLWRWEDALAEFPSLVITEEEWPLWEALIKEGRN